MEPQIIDYYNENPHMMNIIDNMMIYIMKIIS